MSGRRGPQHRPRQRGFTLLEVVVAFALLAAGVGILIGILSGGVRQVRDAQAASEAALYAQSLLDGVLAAGEVEPGLSRGDFDDGRYRWALRIEEFAEPDDEAYAVPDDEPGHVRLHRLVLEVQWDDGAPGRRLRLATLHAGLDPAALQARGGLDREIAP